jgi:hypothetical protein
MFNIIVNKINPSKQEDISVYGLMFFLLYFKCAGWMCKVGTEEYICMYEPSMLFSCVLQELLKNKF